MMHLMTVLGSSAKKLYLSKEHLSDFKSTIRALVAGRSMLFSTRFRSDLLYDSHQADPNAIIKLWAFYANSSISDFNKKDFRLVAGNKNTLDSYFQSINGLSINWYHYLRYQRVFLQAYINDPQNPLLQTIVKCDQHLTQHPSIKRSPLLSINEIDHMQRPNDTFLLAMKIIDNETHIN